jgi:hypothetical protein
MYAQRTLVLKANVGHLVVVVNGSFSVIHS